MHEFMILLRFLHITLGVFWAGTIFFNVLFLGPSVRDAGPDGAKVMQALQRRQLLNILPVVAGLTILTGLILYWRLSGGFAGSWVTSRFGFSLTVGGVASLIAFAIGVFGMRAATLGAGRLGAQLARAPAGEKEAMQLEVLRLRKRAATSSRWVAALLVIAVAAMAVARYL